jgi:hypothetical protein
MSSSPAENASERLERLEREDRKKRWDSVLEAHVSNAARGKTAEPLSERKPQWNPEVGPSDAISIITLLADRLDRIERLAVRLESDLHQQERKARVGVRRAAIGAVIVAVLAAGGLVMGLVHR